MQRALGLFLLVALAAPLFVSARQLPSPAVFWTSLAAAPKISTPALNTHLSEDMLSLLKRSLTETSPEKDADIVFLFSAPPSRTDQFHTHVEALIKPTDNSQTFPYVISSGRTPSDLFVSSAAVKAAQAVFKSNGVASLAEFEEYVKSSNGDNRMVVIVKLPEDSAEQVLVMEKFTQVARNANLHFAALYLSNESEELALEVSFTDFFRKSRHSLAKRDPPTPGEDATAIYPNYWPGGVLEGVIFGIIFIIIALLGICCTSAIQSQERFDKPARRPGH